MYYAPLDSSSVAIGKISAGSAKKTVQNLDGGIIKKIYVKDGDSVNKGDILIELEDIQAQKRHSKSFGSSISRCISTSK